MPLQKLAVDLEQVAITRQHQHDGKLRDNAGIDARAGRNRNAALAPCLQIHMVKARAPTLPKLDIRRVVDDIRIDIQSGNQVFAVCQIPVSLRRQRIDQLEALRNIFVERVVCARKIDADQTDFLCHGFLSPLS